MKSFYSLLLLLVLTISCKKSGTSPTGTGSTGDGDGTVAVTTIGTPVGNPVTKTIGPSGGTISSPDGRARLSIPPGALAANTDISIQPVVNECPGGIGLAYDLLPNGTKFAVPATLTFNYADSDVDGTDPYLLFIGFQDSARQWQINTEDKDVDTVAKTVSLDISHFTIWTIKPYIAIISSQQQLKAGQQAGMFIYKWNTKTGILGTALQTTGGYLPSNQLSAWKVNGVTGGNSQDGTIAGTGPKVIYTAPAVIDKDRYITASVTYTQPITVHLKKAKIITLVNKTFTKKIKLLSGNYIFDIGVSYTLLGASGVYQDTYNDVATFEVDVKNFKVTAVTFTNASPTETPAKGTDGSEDATWIPGDVGLINIAKANGIALVDATSGDTTVLVTIVNLGTVAAKWNIHPLDDSGDYITGGEAVESPLQGFFFDLKNEPQTVIVQNNVNSSLIVIVRPRQQ